MPRMILVYASMGRAPGRKFVKSWQQEPLAIGVLAALTPPEWEIVFFDDRVEDVDYTVKADLVGISVETYSALRGYRIAAEFRKRGVPVILGGFHATLCPEEAMLHADSICVGEAETVWQDILEDAKNGRLKQRYEAAALHSMENIRVNRSLFEGKNYLRLSLIETGRGCPNKCNFCTISAFYKAKYRRRPVADIIREMKEIRNRYILFVDDNFTEDISSTRELLAAMKPLGKKWLTQTSLKGLEDRNFVKEMAAGGCLGVLIGFESLNTKNLSMMNKKAGKQEEFAAILKNLREEGILVYGTFLFGYPHDTKELFEKTVNFAIEEKMFIGAFNHLVPFPGTPLYAKLEREGRMRYDKWWLDSRFHFGEVPFEPFGMTAEDIEMSCLSARKKFYSVASVIRRAADFTCNCASLPRLLFYMRINLMLGWEVSRKRGVLLGFRDQ